MMMSLYQHRKIELYILALNNSYFQAEDSYNFVHQVINTLILYAYTYYTIVFTMPCATSYCNFYVAHRIGKRSHNVMCMCNPLLNK